MDTQSNSTTSGGQVLLTPKELFKRLGYKNRVAGWKAVKRAGIPRIKINARTYRFDETAVHAWLAKRTIGTTGHGA